MTPVDLIDPLLTVLHKRVVQDVRRQTARTGGDAVQALRTYAEALRRLADEIEVGER